MHRNGEFACSRARIIHKQNTADCDVLECINWQGQVYLYQRRLDIELGMNNRF